MTSGNNPDFESVLKLFQKKIYNLAYRLLGNPDEAADLSQETFVSAYKAYTRFRGSSDAIYPWLCRIAVNGCKNRFREMARRGQYEILSLDDPLCPEDSSAGLEIGDESSNPASIFEAVELEGKIQEAIMNLPPEFRVVVILRDMQGLSYGEISEVTGVPLDTVKVRLFRGRTILRRRLSGYISG